MSDLSSFGVGSIWRKRVAPHAFELRRVEALEGDRVRASTHATGTKDSFYTYEFEDLYAPLALNNAISIAGSGHRPEHIATGRYSLEQVREKIYTFYVDLFNWLKPREVISGLARGFDLWLAWAAIEANAPLVGAMPHPDQARGWLEDDQREWEAIVKQYAEVHVISDRYWQKEGDNAMYARNRWMIDRGDVLTSFWQGTKGGTAHANDYAVLIGKTRLVINAI